MHKKVVLMVTEVTHQLSSFFNQSIRNWNHDIGSVVMKDSPGDNVVSWLFALGTTSTPSLPSVSVDTWCAGNCVGISHPKSSILLGFNLNCCSTKLFVVRDSFHYDFRHCCLFDICNMHLPYMIVLILDLKLIFT